MSQIGQMSQISQMGQKVKSVKWVKSVNVFAGRQNDLFASIDFYDYYDFPLSKAAKLMDGMDKNYHLVGWSFTCG